MTDPKFFLCLQAEGRENQYPMVSQVTSHISSRSKGKPSKYDKYIIQDGVDISPEIAQKAGKAFKNKELHLVMKPIWSPKRTFPKQPVEKVTSEFLYHENVGNRVSRSSQTSPTSSSSDLNILGSNVSMTKKHQLYYEK